MKPYLSHEIDTTTYAVDILLLLLSFAVGVVDAAVFSDYRLFVSNQTGNTIFLGIGAIKPDSNLSLKHIGVSLGGFISASLTLGQAGKRFGPRQRGWVLATSAFQTILTFIAAAFRHWFVASVEDSDPRVMAVVVLLAFSSGTQVAMARDFENEIPTAMITRSLSDLFTDPKLLKLKGNRGRDRRLFFILSLLVGGFIGATAYVYCAPGLPYLLGALIKMIVTTGFLFCKKKGA